MSLHNCTLTGIDEQTDLSALVALTARYPFVEWGFLYSPSQEGQPGRYPSVSFLRRALEWLPQHVYVALHVCGSGVSSLIACERVAAGLADMVRARSCRLQLNFNITRRPMDTMLLNRFIEGYGHQVITQHNKNNACCTSVLNAPNHAVLFDESGGTGQERQDWPTPLTGVYCGYAGGLGPDNLAAQLPLIQAKTGHSPYWIDMEGKLRNSDDRFDLSRAEQCLTLVREFIDMPTKWYGC